MEKEKGIPKIWEVALVAIVPIAAFFGWAIRIIMPGLFE